MKWFFPAAAVFLAACSSAPAEPAAETAIVASHDYEARYHDAPRALETLKTLASDAYEGRRTGEPGNLKAMAWIEARLDSLDAEPWNESGYRAPFVAARFDSPENGVRGTNILARIDGTAGAGGPVLVMSAHFDHLGAVDGEIYNGADDNASGVAALLETLAWFKEHPPRNTLLFAFFDAEEQGLSGSTSFVATLPDALRQRVAMNLNLDMVARADKGELYAVGTSHFPELAGLIDGVAADAPIRLLRGHDTPDWGDQDWSFLSDHAAFVRAGIPSIYLGVEDHADYHQPSDEFENVDPEAFARSIDTIVLVAEAADGWVTAQAK